MSLERPTPAAAIKQRPCLATAPHPINSLGKANSYLRGKKQKMIGVEEVTLGRQLLNKQMYDRCQNVISSSCV